jgi:hypothetical protein
MSYRYCLNYSKGSKHLSLGPVMGRFMAAQGTGVRAGAFPVAGAY